MIVLQLVVWLDAVASRAPAPTRHGEGALRPWGRCPLIPRRFSSSPYRERYTHITSNHKKQLLQLGKNISPTRKIEKHTPANIANPANLANIGLGTDMVRRRSRLINLCSILF